MPATSTHLRLARDEQPLDLRSDADLARTPAFIGMIAAVVILALGAGPTLTRAGFSSDEEITALTVRGIAATGLPVLPSGILHLRGVLYTYAAWLAGGVLGHSLPVYRAVSLLFAILAVLLMFCVARQVGTTTTAVWAALLLASFQSHIAAAAFARFYSAFVAASLLTIWLFQRSREMHRNEWAFLVALGACRLVHEFAVVLVLLPLCQAVCTPRGDPSRRRWFALCLKSAALLGVIQIGLTGLEGLSIATHLGTTNLRLGFFGSVPLAPLPLPVHRLAGPAGLLLIAAWHVLAGAVTRRITHAPWWTIVAYGVCAFLFQMGALLMVGVVAMLSQPRQAVRILFAGGMLAAASAGRMGSPHGDGHRCAVFSQAGLPPRLGDDVVSVGRALAPGRDAHVDHAGGGCHRDGARVPSRGIGEGYRASRRGAVQRRHPGGPGSIERRAAVAVRAPRVAARVPPVGAVHRVRRAVARAQVAV